MNALSLACMTKNLGQVQMAISRGSKPDAATLDEAIRSRDAKIVQAVISCGAFPSNVSLSLACIYGDNDDIFNSVMVLGAKPDEETYNHAIGKQSKFDIVYRLGGRPNAKSLEFACGCYKNSENFVNLVIKHGATIATSDAVCNAFSKVNSSEMTISTLDKVIALCPRIDSDNQTLFGVSLSCYTSNKVKIDCLKKIVTLGAKPSQYDLTRAITSRMTELVQLVLDTGVKPTNEDINLAYKLQNSKTDINLAVRNPGSNSAGVYKLIKHAK
jgi:hypothetical protein